METNKQKKMFTLNVSGHPPDDLKAFLANVSVTARGQWSCCKTSRLIVALNVCGYETDAFRHLKIISVIVTCLSRFCAIKTNLSR